MLASLTTPQLLSMVMGQKRTGKHKRFVALTPDYVYKGPYNQSTLTRLSQLYQTLAELKTPLIVQPLTYIPYQAGGYFLVYPNLESELGQADWHQESFSDYSYQVIRRQNLVKVSDVNWRLGQTDWLYQQLEEVLICCLTLTILGVGDLGLYNILANLPQQSLHLVDLDETTSQTSLESRLPFFYLSRAPRQSIAQDWLRLTNYPRLLFWLLTSPLDQYCQTVDSQQRYLTSLKLLDQLTTGLLEPTSRALKYSGGPFAHSTSSQGYLTDALKSGLQKYIRRGLAKPASLCTMQLYQFSLVGATSLITNLRNRLTIIALEDVGPADPILVQYVLTRLSPDCQASSLELFILTQLMAETKKTRLPSHWAHYYSADKVEASSTESLISNLRQALVQAQPIAFSYWAQLNLSLTNTKVKRPFPRYLQKKSQTIDPLNVSWLILEDYLPSPLFQVLHQAYLRIKNQDSVNIVRAALTLAIVRDKLDLSEEAHQTFLQHLNKTYQAWLSSADLPAYLASLIPLTLDDFVYDKHTQQGRQAGANLADFVQEGAEVTNQHPLFLDTVALAAYRQRK